EYALHLFIEKVADLLHDRHGINLFFRVLAQIDENVKKIVNVRHVEVAGHDEVTTSPVVLSEEWVDVLNTVHPMCAISEVPQPQLARKSDVLLEPFFICSPVRVRLQGFSVFLADLPEKVRNRLRFYGAVAADVAVTGFEVEFDVCNTCSILTPVVLLLHQDVHLVHRESRAVLM